MVKKITIYENFKVKKFHKNSIILIGNFDGLHVGHQKLFKLAQIYKKKFKRKIGVVTFNPLPKMFFNKKIKNYKLSNLNQKLHYFQKFNVDFLINKKFDKKFSEVSSNQFIKRYIYKNLNAKFIFVSNNFRFGHKREGDLKLLKLNQNNYNYKLINPSPLKKNNTTISSTLIRKLLEQGYLNKANNLLKRNWSIEGKVIRGRMMGKTIGFPTCNIELEDYIIPMPGVYAVKVQFNKNDRKFKGIANLGYRPTFNQNKILLEVNIFNFSGNAYNKKLSVEFVKFIRKEKKFSGIEELKKQIKKDVSMVKK